MYDEFECGVEQLRSCMNNIQIGQQSTDVRRLRMFHVRQQAKYVTIVEHRTQYCSA
jgi:hypothetical protein